MIRPRAVPSLVLVFLLTILLVSGGHRIVVVLALGDDFFSSCVFTPIAYFPDLRSDLLIFWLSPFCHVFLHTDLMHLLVNTFFMLAFATPIVKRISMVRSIIFMIVTALASVSVYFLPFTPTYIYLIGASGVVSGFLGALLRLGLWRGKRPPPAPPFDRKITATVLLISWLAMNIIPFLGTLFGHNIAWEAHLGGFAAGFFLYPLFEAEAGKAAPVASSPLA